jgi:DNA-binding GntR family transcriptional regulator
MIVERASGNTYLDTVVSPLRHQTELVFTMLTDTRGLLSWDEHQAIYDALKAGDAETARAATAQHMDNVIVGMVLRAPPGGD